MKQTILLLSILLLGISVGMFINKPSSTEYHVQLLDYDQAEIMDDQHKLLKTTSVDSIGYYLIQDNI